MYFTYVLYSSTHDRYYKGFTQNIKTRLKLHNSGQVKSTKPFVPWELVYFEEFQTKEEALLREKYFKTAAGRRYLKIKL